MNAKLILPEGVEAPEVDNVIQFQGKALPGGKDPTYNWLKDLKEGTIFVCKRRQNPPGTVQQFLDEFCLVNNRMKTYLLVTNLNQDAFFRVLPEEFSRLNELVEVLEEGKE